MQGMDEFRRAIAILFVLLCAAAFPGCTKKSNSCTVSGIVTLDGEPVKSGIIRFVPTDGKTATADSIITDGKYSASVPPGAKTVSISSPKVIGKKKAYDATTGPEIDVTQEIIPAKYNVQSNLTLTVENGSLEHDIPLKSAP
jgi:hypothetical protein